MAKTKNYLKDEYRRFIHTSRYARWIESEKRRESWEETVDRYVKNIVEPKVDESVKLELREALLENWVCPSMRAMMTAGPALHRDNTCAYNCSYVAVEETIAFDEAMFILLCGTGVGFSVERQFISKLPVVPESFVEGDKTIVVEDSKEGWAKALREVVHSLYDGVLPKWDISNVRPAGARLKTFGGRASGPGPLVELFRYFTDMFVNAAGRKLSSIECHDLMCKIGEVVVVGGVRRSAMISLSNLSDDRMRSAKSGTWWENNAQRALANNSVAYSEKPEMGIFMKEWFSLYESKSGERGIFNREASRKQAAKNGRRNPDFEFGTNPLAI